MPKKFCFKTNIVSHEDHFIPSLFRSIPSYSENGYSQSTKISIPRSSLKVSELLSKIESQTEYLFVYNKKKRRHQTLGKRASR